MKIKIIACMVLAKELYSLASKSKNIIDIDMVNQQLHCTPEKLHQVLQMRIDKAENEDTYDAIGLLYGLCSNAVIGLMAKRTPLIIPKTHDCIGLLLGSKERYSELNAHYGGKAYWYSKGWTVNELLEMPSPKHFEKLRDTYLEKYGEENVEFLINTQLEWSKEYRKVVFIDWDEMDTENDKAEVVKIADALELEYEVVKGSNLLIKKFLEGEWNEEVFLKVLPNQGVVVIDDDDIIKCICKD